MPNSKEYHLQAKECLELANRPDELYERTVLIDLAAEFNDAADELESRERSGVKAGHDRALTPETAAPGTDKCPTPNASTDRV
jgi:hypothetical protein